ncbi:hypothetical protein CHUAL_001691 [Chamberlinius hualienensis]
MNFYFAVPQRGLEFVKCCEFDRPTADTKDKVCHQDGTYSTHSNLDERNLFMEFRMQVALYYEACIIDLIYNYFSNELIRTKNDIP